MKITYIIKVNNFNDLGILTSYMFLVICGSINVATVNARCAALRGSLTVNVAGNGRVAI
jgi:hypothetical protein